MLWRCDGKNDCLDGSDEDHFLCRLHPKHHGLNDKCKDDEFKCKRGKMRSRRVKREIQIYRVRQQYAPTPILLQ